MKKEIKLIYDTYVEVQNGNFQLYTEYWHSTTETPCQVQSLTDPTQLVWITCFDNWSFVNGSLVHSPFVLDQSPIWQELTLPDTTIVEPYFVQFTVNNTQVSFAPSGVTCSLFGFNGTKVYGNGTYTQIIYVDPSDLSYNNKIQFTPETGFSGGITNVSIKKGYYSYSSIDLYDDESLNLTFQITTNLADRGASYSKTIKLPGTNNNNKVFKFILNDKVWFDVDTINNESVVFLNKKIDAIIYEDSIELLKGYFELQSVTNTNGVIEYDGVFYSNSKNLAEKIGDKKIRGNDNSYDDIDFGQYGHRFNWRNIKNSWRVIHTWDMDYPYKVGDIVSYLSVNYICIVNIPGPGILPTNVTFYSVWTDTSMYSTSTGYFYPLIDYSNLTTGNEVRIENFKPCIYVKELWDTIFNKAGFSYTSTFLNSDTFKSLIIPQSSVSKERDAYRELTKFQVGVYDEYKIIETYSGIDPFWVRISYNKQTGDTCFDNNDNWDVSDSSWTLEDSNSYSIISSTSIHVTANHRSYPDNSPWSFLPGDELAFTMRIMVLRNGNVFELKRETVKFPLTNDQGYNNRIVVNDTIQVHVEETDLYLDDKIYAEVTMDAKNYILEHPSYFTFKMYVNNTVSSSNTGTTYIQNEPIDKPYYLENQWVNTNDVLPVEMKQIDFIKSVANKFNLVVSEDVEVLNGLIIEPYDIFYNITDYIDWSDKVDISKEKLIERIPVLLNKDIQFNFKNDDSDKLLTDYLTATKKGFGNQYVQNPYLNESTEKVEDSFSSTMMGVLGSTNIVVSKIYNEDDPDNLPTSENYNTRFLYRSILRDDNLLFTFDYVIILKPVIGNDVNATLTYYDANGDLMALMYGYYPYAGYLDNPYLPYYDFNYGPSKYTYNPYSSGTIYNLVWYYWRNKLSLYLDVNGKQTTYYIRLNNSDIATLNFRKPIMIDGNLYHLNKIIEWVSTESCKVELLQLTTTTSEFINNTEAWKQEYTTLKTTKNKDTVVNLNKIVKNTQQTTAVFPTYTGTTIYIDSNNHFPQDSKGVVIGSGNRSSDSFLIIGNNNVLTDDSYVINGNYNTLNKDNTLINSNNITVNVLTGGTIYEIGTLSGETITVTTGITYNTSVLALNFMENSGKTITTPGFYIGDLTYSGSTKSLVINEEGKVFYSYGNGFGSGQVLNIDGGRPCEIYTSIPVLDAENISC